MQHYQHPAIRIRIRTIPSKLTVPIFNFYRQFSGQSQISMLTISAFEIQHWWR